MTRREFLHFSAIAAAGTLLPAVSRAQASPEPRSQPKIPRWRGFNLTEMSGPKRGHTYRESDFEWMQGWGFDFVRLPLSYWQWSSPKDWMAIDADAFAPLDRALELAKQHGVHVSMCLHRIPGYCVNGRELEPDQLFESTPDSMKRALDAALYHWSYLAERYKDVPASRLSFDLLNEPPFMKDQARYVEICKTLIAGIRGKSHERLIFANGADLGQTPVVGLIDEGIVQSSHDYQPKMISHYKAA
jgi:endoglucanase